MGLFGKKTQPEPVRRDRVRELIKTGMRERDESDRSVDSKKFDKAHDAHDRAERGATQAEIRAAHEPLRRNGY